jgi:hypothetical protein
MIFSDLQSGFSHKMTILSKILLGNVCWLHLIIIWEFNGHSKSGLGLKIIIKFLLKSHDKGGCILLPKIYFDAESVLSVEGSSTNYDKLPQNFFNNITFIIMVIWNECII